MIVPIRPGSSGTRPESLTRRQREVLNLVLEWHRDLGVAPTLDEIGFRLELSKSTVHGHIQALCEKGHLTKDRPGCSRGIQLAVANLGGAA